MTFLVVSIVVVLLVIIFFYNKMKALFIKSEETFANIDVIFKQRFDTLPNLVETVKGYAKHEKETLQRVTELREYLQHPHLTDEEKMKAHVELDRRIPDLLAVAEDYPELQASENFLHLQNTIVLIEENLSAARRTYNAITVEYNTFIQMFPTLLFANMFGFRVKELFEAQEVERKNIAIRF